MTNGEVEPPPLDAVDVYLYAFGNGGIYRYDADRRSGFVTLAEAVEVAETCGSFGGRVFLGGGDGPLAEHVREAVRATGVPIVDHDAPVPPYVWDDDADALMAAAAGRQDDVFDDLLDRGADVHATNAKGATALHHAAAAGYVHGIDRLLAAGADPDARNDAGLTPLMAAQACREHEAALRLEAAGATPSHAGGASVRFRWTHHLPQLGGMWTGFIFAVFAFGIGLKSGVLVAVVAAVVVAVVGGLLGQPASTWTGCIPRAFDGRLLRGRTLLGRTVEIDLDDVTQAVYGGAGGRYARLVGSKLVLVHAGGRPMKHAVLRRALRPKDEADLVEDGARATFVLLDPVWEHEVLRPVGNRLISDPVEVSPRLRQRLQRARDQDPTRPADRSGRR